MSRVLKESRTWVDEVRASLGAEEAIHYEVLVAIAERRLQNETTVLTDKIVTDGLLGTVGLWGKALLPVLVATVVLREDPRATMIDPINSLIAELGLSDDWAYWVSQARHLKVYLSVMAVDSGLEEYL
jgi:hypothetical protein